MMDYELAAYQSIERMKEEHQIEINYLKEDYASSPRPYKRSKKVVDFRAFEAKTFSTKNYDGATYYKVLAEKLEQEERTEHQQKLFSMFNNEEQRLRRMQKT